MEGIVKEWSKIVNTYKRFIYRGSVSFEEEIKEYYKLLENERVKIERVRKHLLEKIERMEGINQLESRIKDNYQVKLLRSIFEHPPDNHLNDVIGIRVVTSTPEKAVEVAYNLLSMLSPSNIYFYATSPFEGRYLLYDWESKKVELTDVNEIKNYRKKYVTVAPTNLRDTHNLPAPLLKNYYTSTNDTLASNHPVKYKAIHIDGIVGIIGLPFQIIITDEENDRLQKEVLDHRWYINKRLEYIESLIRKMPREEKERGMEVFEKVLRGFTY